MKSMSFWVISLLSIAAMVLAATMRVSSGQETTGSGDQPRPEKFGPGDHTIRFVVDNLKRTAIVHVPPNYDPEKPTPVVLVLHGAAMSGHAMVYFCGLNATADKNDFITVYPSGTGVGPLLTWNAGGFANVIASRVDDVTFLNRLIDEVSLVCNVDPKRVYASGLSNGGMMSYRMAAEMSNRIAAIAAIGRHDA